MTLMHLACLLGTSGCALSFAPLLRFSSWRFAAAPTDLSSSARNNLLRAGRTLYDKIFDAHKVEDMGGKGSNKSKTGSNVREEDKGEEQTVLMYIDRHLVHEVTSPQAFEGLRLASRTVRRPDCTLATCDHNVPTSDRSGFESAERFISDPESRAQVVALERNVVDFGLTYFGMDDVRQGIVHIIGPEQGFTQPGMTIVCGDSHTATHGAFGSLAFGVGTSEVEHVMATQTLVQQKGKNMRVTINGTLGPGVTSKDVALHVIGLIGTAGGTGSVIEFAGSTVEAMSMEARMSVCNMAIEAGARAGMVAPDEVTFEYLRGRPMVPSGDLFARACASWRSLRSDPDASWDREVAVDATAIAPSVTWGTSPQDVSDIGGRVPEPAGFIDDPQRRAAVERSLAYMGFAGGEALEGVAVDKVFVGSCTNGRIEDLREVAKVAAGRHVAPTVKRALVVPGSGLVKAQAELEGLDKVLIKSGFEWREPGCSMCLAMNADKLEPKERCASTSNRNFEGRQGTGGRTHLMSPAMAAAAAVTGYLTDVRKLKQLQTLPDPVAWPKDAWRSESTAKASIKALEKSSPSPATKPLTPGPSTSPSGQTIIDPSVASAGMPPFTLLKGVAAKLDIENVDTDMIIPKQFLKTVKRTGLGVSAFFDLRYDPATGRPEPAFVLNQAPYDAAKILVVGANFGCGSSREHAPWALLDFGIKCIISTNFADIFFGNCFKNGMLPIVLPKATVRELMADCDAAHELEVDLIRQIITRSDGTVIKFDVDSFRKKCLVYGLDDIGLTLERADAIASYEAKRIKEAPWTFNLA